MGSAHEHAGKNRWKSYNEILLCGGTWRENRVGEISKALEDKIWELWKDNTSSRCHELRQETQAPSARIHENILRLVLEISPWGDHKGRKTVGLGRTSWGWRCGLRYQEIEVLRCNRQACDRGGEEKKTLGEIRGQKTWN